MASKRNSEELSRAYNVIENTFDVEMSEEKKRYVVLPGKTSSSTIQDIQWASLFSNLGVDDKLDEKKRLHNGLPGQFSSFVDRFLHKIFNVKLFVLDLMHQVVQEEVEDLPECMTECSMVYVPHVGYMLAVKPW